GQRVSVTVLSVPSAGARRSEVFAVIAILDGQPGGGSVGGLRCNRLGDVRWEQVVTSLVPSEVELQVATPGGLERARFAGFPGAISPTLVVSSGPTPRLDDLLSRYPGPAMAVPAPAPRTDHDVWPRG